jgi:S-layer homology domain
LDTAINREDVALLSARIGEACGTFNSDNYNYGYNNYSYCEGIFDDVDEDDEEVCRAVEMLANNDIITARTNSSGRTLFKPNTTITRAEALAMILGSADTDYEDTYYDNWRFNGTNFSTWQKPLIQFAYDEDIISSISSF